MSLFEVVSNDVVLTTVPFAQATALANEQRKQGTQVIVRRARARLRVQPARGWAVQLSGSGKIDVLQCLDEEDAKITLAALRAHGIRARIVRR